MKIRFTATVANTANGTVRSLPSGTAKRLIDLGVAEHYVSATPEIDLSSAAIREWAVENNIQVSAKGFIKKSVIEAYKAAKEV